MPNSLHRAKGRVVAVLDCETDPFCHGRVPEPFLWGFWDGVVYREFESTVECAKFLRRFNGIVYAHNGGKFDFHYLASFINSYTPLLIVNGRLVSARLGECELRDSYAAVPVALADYQKTAIDYRRFERPVRAKYMTEIRAYLRDDCVNLYELIVAFCTRYGKAAKTLPSAAMQQWQKICGKRVEKTNAAFYRAFRQG